MKISISQLRWDKRTKMLSLIKSLNKSVLYKTLFIHNEALIITQIPHQCIFVYEVDKISVPIKILMKQ